MKLIFIYGWPSAGKLTVAQELSALTGYKLFHNHLAVDLLLSVFEFGSMPFVELREQIQQSCSEQACCGNGPGVIFSFAPEATVRPDFVDRAITSINGEVIFVELVCPLAELKQRIHNPSRLQFGTLTSAPLFEQLAAEVNFDALRMPRPRLCIASAHPGRPPGKSRNCCRLMR